MCELFILEVRDMSRQKLIIFEAIIEILKNYTYLEMSLPINKSVGGTLNSH